MINWTHVIRRHCDFVKDTSPENTPASEVGVCLRDGCGSANFHGPDAWISAAKFLGFKVNDTDEVGGIE